MVIRRRRKTGIGVRAVAYVRCSTSKQDLSPAAQGEAIERWAASEGVELAATFFDLATSGGADISERPGLAMALGSLRDLGATVLLVAKRDRLARDVRVAADVAAMAARAGAKVLSADGQGNGDSDGDALMRDITDVLSAHERRLIRSRTKAALAVKRARGERVGAIPFGSRLAADGVHLEADPAESAVIARAKALSDDGLSCRAIAAKLTDEGAHGRTGQPLSHTQVHRMLRPLLLAEAGE